MVYFGCSKVFSRQMQGRPLIDLYPEAIGILKDLLYGGWPQTSSDTGTKIKLLNLQVPSRTIWMILPSEAFFHASKSIANPASADSSCVTPPLAGDFDNFGKIAWFCMRTRTQTRSGREIHRRMGLILFSLQLKNCLDPNIQAPNLPSFERHHRPFGPANLPPSLHSPPSTAQGAAVLFIE